MNNFFAALILIVISAMPSQAIAEENRSGDCKIDDLARFYAESYSAAWAETLTDALVSIEANNIKNYGDIYVSNSDINRLRNAYRKMVEKYYSSDAWLPGTRDYVNEHLTLAEQCQLLMFYKTEIGSKALRMQTAPGASEFIRQQATNFRRKQKDFYFEREDALKKIFPTLPSDFFLRNRSYDL